MTRLAIHVRYQTGGTVAARNRPWQPVRGHLAQQEIPIVLLH
ncbi:MAG: hypothetical protein WBO97_03450 [Tepidiformaceae bacterium]